MGTARRASHRGRATTDHPHGRGDGAVDDGRTDLGAGSPPRAWGRPCQRHHQPPGRRITPTGVGTAIESIHIIKGRSDHPHGRGDGNPMSRQRHDDTGSPPRAWGRRPAAGGDDPGCRITPTGVGTAGAAGGVHALNADHPHGRGDGTLTGGLTMRYVGSPPRAWGRQTHQLTHPPSRRITPTGVGTAVIVSDRNKIYADHPHGRGDGGGTTSGVPRTSGSPPRAWGRPAPVVACPPWSRITPTGVGTAYLRRGPERPAADHPHGRGDGAVV